MKLFRFGPKGQEKPGVLVDGQHKDCSAYFEDWNHNFFNNDGLIFFYEMIIIIIEKKFEMRIPDKPNSLLDISNISFIFAFGSFTT